MKQDARQRQRRSIRLRGYDYSQNGAYFVTVCVQNRECVFGQVVNGEMILNEAGCMVEDEWLKTPAVRPEVELDEFVMMPNHFHAIIMIRNKPGIVGATRRVAPTGPMV